MKSLRRNFNKTQPEYSFKQNRLQALAEKRRPLLTSSALV